MPSKPQVNATPAGGDQTASAAAPRKRRKRTVGSAAAEDCFTCANRGTKCDRRRPYCSQCLDMGQDCSGYKTTLTWGVGVASRGKLRGLSLPVSGGQPVAHQKARKQAATVNNNNTVKSQQRQNTQSSHPSDRSRSSTAVNEPPTARSEPNPISPGKVQAQTNRRWTAEVPRPREVSEAPSSYVNHNSFTYQGSCSSNPLTISCFGAHDKFVEPKVPRAAKRTYQTGIPATFQDSVPPSWPHIASPCSEVGPGEPSLFGHYTTTVSPDWRFVASRKPAATEEEEVGKKSAATFAQLPLARQSYCPWSYHNPFAASLPHQLLEQSVGRTPRMKYLISYFMEVIAPVIVAFDSPTNPYRTRIPRLARDNETLQHAIAALSASNLRQRRESKILSTERTVPARMSSLAHRALTDVSFQDQFGIKEPGDSKQEELYHKAMAIKTLNTQLADPTRRHKDSVLATLLVLCLFNICETGVAEFQNHFAGVQKLLAMRSRGAGIGSEEARWCTRMFTWFDAMTATINNREGQLHDQYLDMSTLSDEEWALENLAGCDGRLFKVIARLGRLNVLSQNRPVQPPSATDVPVATPILPPSMTHYTMHEPLSSTTMTTGVSSFPMSFDVDLADQIFRAAFWKEWYSIRQRLESWRLDTPTSGDLSPSNSCASLSSSTTSGSSSFVSPPLSPVSQYFVAPGNLTDLSNISESFRYSALLYTERLAFPDTPSSHSRIQNLVIVALHYISSVHSDVYLLWPLFVTGAECVHEEHREIIRQRCKDIQKDSGFYNNISCLELLEKIWAKNPIGIGTAQRHNSYIPPALNNDGNFTSDFVSNLPGSQWTTASQPIGSPLLGGQAFKWHSVIESEDAGGEYIVV
ncbi:hypothetical protein Egran_03038 [Elaphomyces granulatus]|uniref:Zn(2)-C6 fungal-type domain-containing protein n=1 Tax=Elaphomyces granulatus TaxID=519963 RepID=A0A232LZF5_9EURO|nr:hypothetical protein Egran_03038 [Elaphomyces granulatus]